MCYIGTTQDIDNEIAKLRVFFLDNPEFLERNKSFYDEYLRVAGYQIHESKEVQKLYISLNKIKLLESQPKFCPRWLWRRIWQLI